MTGSGSLLLSLLLQCRNITHGYGPRPLFSGMSLAIHQGERLGIVGPNGAGKSTLLALLGGELAPDEGEVTPRRGLRIVLVSQAERFPADGGPGAIDWLAEQAARCFAEGDARVRAASLLTRHGFGDGQQAVGRLSGGQGKRLAILGGLVQDPDLLLLDEPTNHLDLDSILWLEDLLARASFTWAVVSHARMFLERTAGRMVEVSGLFPTGLLAMDGNWSRFCRHRADYLEGLQSRAGSLSNKMRREEEWLSRGPKARTTKANYRIEEAQRLREELAGVREQLQNRDRGLGDFTASGRRSRRLIHVENCSFARGKQSIVRDLTFTLNNHQILGLLGANGSGKSTLLSLLRGELRPEQGRIEQAPELRVVWFSQDRSQLNPEDSLRRALAPEGDHILYRGRQVHVVGWAARFGFATDRLDVLVRDLSGGEQARALIAGLVRSEADVLLLDEPTNDLDIPALEALERSLGDFPGAVVLVTHDRWLISRLADRFLCLNGGGAWQMLASYDQWEKTQSKAGRAAERKETPKKQAPDRGGRRPPRLSYLEQREFDGMEERILTAEQTLAEAEAALEDPAIARDAGKLTEATRQLATAREEVEGLYQRWSELEGKIAGKQ